MVMSVLAKVAIGSGAPAVSDSNDMDRVLYGAGRILFGVSLIAFGVQNVWFQGTFAGLELTPEWAPAHAFWAWLMGAALLAAGLGIAVGWRTRLAASIAGVVYLASVLFYRIPKLDLFNDIGERTRILEPLSICCGAFLLAGALRSESTGWRAWDNILDRAFTPARIVLGVTMIIFGIAHFQIPAFIASLIPPFIPFHLFFAWFTGVGFVAAGLTMVTKWQMRFGAMMLGLMFFLWVVLLHRWRVAGALHNTDEWNSMLIAMAICGESWILAGLPEWASDRVRSAAQGGD